MAEEHHEEETEQMLALLPLHSDEDFKERMLQQLSSSSCKNDFNQIQFILGRSTWFKHEEVKYDISLISLLLVFINETPVKQRHQGLRIVLEESFEDGVW